MTDERLTDIHRRTRGSLPIDQWGPKCNGCGDDEFRIDGYCSIECRDYHSDGDVEELLAALEAVTKERDAAREERDSFKHDRDLNKGRAHEYFDRAEAAEADAEALAQAAGVIKDADTDMDTVAHGMWVDDFDQLRAALAAHTARKEKA